MAALYYQFVAYARAYAQAIPLYEPADNHLVKVTVGASLALSSICNAIAFGSADLRAGSVPPQPPIKGAPTDLDSIEQGRLPKEANPVCPDIDSLLSNFASATADWMTLDPNIPAANWNMDQRALSDNVVPEMNSFADGITELGTRSGDPIFEGLSKLAAQYRRAFAAALPSYVPADNYINEVATAIAGALNEACFAAGNR